MAESLLPRLTVLHLISTLEAGGAQTMLCNLVASSYTDVNHRVIAMLDGGSQVEVLRSHGVPVRTLGMESAAGRVASLLTLPKLIRTQKPDIVQTWMYHADLAGLIAKALIGAKVVWNVRSAVHLGLDSHLTRLCARLSRLPDAVVVNSAVGMRVHAERGYQPRRWALIGNGFDTAVFRPSEEHRQSVRRELSLTNDSFLIGLVGRYDPHKGHGMFLTAARALVLRHPEVHFLLVGEGATPDNAALTDVIATNGMTDRFHLLGRRSDIPRLTAALDVASLTSVGEAFPTVVGEAMACAVPCVATDVGDAARVIDDASLVVPSGDAEAMARAWARIIQMPRDERRALGARGRARIEAEFSIAVVARQYVELYRELMRSAV